MVFITRDVLYAKLMTNKKNKKRVIFDESRFSMFSIKQLSKMNLRNNMVRFSMLCWVLPHDRRHVVSNWASPHVDVVECFQ